MRPAGATYRAFGPPYLRRGATYRAFGPPYLRRGPSYRAFGPPYLRRGAGYRAFGPPYLRRGPTYRAFGPPYLRRGSSVLCGCTKIVLAVLCACINLGCASFQTGASQPVDAAERVLLDGRGQVRVIERNPGGAETVLLVHGYGASSASWTPIVPQLSARYRVLAVDLPGFGRSDKREGDYSPDALADVLAHILDAKHVQRAHVVGHSWGCSVVLAFARRHRDRLAKLAIVSGWMYDEQLLPLMRWAQVKGIGELLYAWVYRDHIGERLYLNFSDSRMITERVVEEVERNMDSPGALAAALAAARGMAQLAVNELGYGKIDAPTLILWGRDDHVARLAFGEKLARDLPRARLTVIPRCGHIPMLECTGETAIALTEFLAAPAEATP